MLRDIEKTLFGRAAEELSAIERRVLQRARERRILSTNAHEDFLAGATVGQRFADAIARIGGSWAFILGFIAFLMLWALLNTVVLVVKPFDPYPFIFLNLLLSMLAAIQAPIIMMSQNRQAERDRFMAAKDYEINLKAEIEVLALHHKIDESVINEIKTLREQLNALSQEIAVVSAGLPRP